MCMNVSESYVTIYYMSNWLIWDMMTCSQDERKLRRRLTKNLEYSQHDVVMLLLTIFPLCVRGARDPVITTFFILVIIFPYKHKVIKHLCTPLLTPPLILQQAHCRDSSSWRRWKWGCHPHSGRQCGSLSSPALLHPLSGFRETQYHP